MAEHLKNHEVQASFFSKLLFTWMNPVFKLGNNLNDLNYMKMNETDRSESQYYTYCLFKSMYPERSIFKYIFKTIQSLWLKQLFFGLLYSVFSVMPSFLLHLLLKSGNSNEFILYLLLMVLAIILTSLFVNQTYFCGNRLVMRVNSILLSDIAYRTLEKKQFEIPISENILNLVNIDVKIVAEFSRILYYLVTAPIQILTCTIVLCSFLGYPGLVALLILLLTVPIQKFLQGKILKLQTKILEYTDKRLQSTNDLLDAIQIVKLNAWENFFEKRIGGFRDLEIQTLRRFKWFMGSFDLLFSLVPTLIPYIVITLSLSLGNSLPPSSIFGLLSILQIIQYPIREFPETALKYFEFKVSISRLQDFLQIVDIKENVNSLNYVGFKHAKLGYLKEGHESASADDYSFMLDINLKVPENCLTVILGKSGSGKSSFLKALLGQVPLYEGEISRGIHENAANSVSYVSQIPWLMNASIRSNILFFQKYDPIRYQHVINICSLSHDLDIITDGDETIANLNLSGGQKQRIALARALYSNHEIYLFDDIFASLDSSTAQDIISNVFLQELRSKTRIICTNNPNLILPQADYVILMKDGRPIIHGSPEQLKDKLSGFDKMLLRAPISEKASLNTEHEQKSKAFEKIYGDTKFTTYLLYIKCLGGIFIFLLFLGGDLFLQILGFLRDYNLKLFSMEPKSIYLNNYIYIVIAYSIAHLIFTFFKVVSDMLASKKIHKLLLKSVLYSKVEFFRLNSVGKILNRFSNDMLIIDKTLNISLFSVAYFVINIASIFVFIIFFVPWFSIPAFVVAFAYYKVSVYFLKTGRELKRLESSFKSPLMNEYLNAIEGATFIDVFSVKSNFIENLSEKIDLYNNIQFQLNCANRWLSIRSDLMGSIIVLSTGLALIAVPDIGIVGLVLTYALNITNSRYLFLLSYLVTSASRKSRDGCLWFRKNRRIY
eukprot:NODE_41_length_34096_cov_2.002235.p1 type:complete len:947 gc:universal NODE_41_length_34096_cov_2.002235:10830-13670(+)